MDYQTFLESKKKRFSGDVVLFPFAGIGSEGYQALKMGRKFVGVELKDSYAEVAVRNLQAAEAERLQGSLPL